MPSQAHVVSAYKRLAPIYDWLFGRVFEQGRAAMEKQVRTLRPTSLLEIGVGTGLALRHYPDSTIVHGIDVCPQMLERARQNARNLPTRSIDLRLMDAEALEYPDGAFDCVTIPYVLSVTADPARLIREARRVCKPDGTILILNHFSEGGIWQRLEWLADAIGNAAGFRAKFDYREVIAPHDWRVTRNERVNPLGLSRFLVIENGRAT